MVDHPANWKESGYYEIMHPKNRYAIIDYDSLLKILGIETLERLQDLQQEWIKDALERKHIERESKWTEAIAVGNEAFLENIRQQLNIKAKSRKIKKNGETYELSEPFMPYNALF